MWVLQKLVMIRQLKNPRYLYLAAHLPQMALGVVLVVVFSRLVESSEFGVFARTYAYVNIASAFIFGWVQMSFLRKANGSSDFGPIEFVVLFQAIFASSALVLVVTIFFGAVGLLDFPLLSALAAISYSSSISFSQYARGANKPAAYALISMLRFVGILSAGLLLAYAEPSAASLIAAVAIGAALPLPYAAVMAYRNSRRLGLVVDVRPKETLLGLLKYGFPASVSLLAVMVMIHGDRFVAGVWLPLDVLGYYSAQVDIARQTVYPIIAALATSLVPTALAKSRSVGVSEAVRYVGNESDSLLKISAPLVMVTIFFPDVVLGLLLSGDYSTQVDSIATISALAAWVMAVRLIKFDPVFHLYSKPGLISLSAIAGLVCWGVVVVPFGALFGPNGFASSALFAGVVAVLAAVFLSRRAALPCSIVGKESFRKLCIAVAIFLVFVGLVRYWGVDGEFAAIGALIATYTYLYFDYRSLARR